MLVKVKYKHVENSLISNDHECGLANSIKEHTNAKKDLAGIRTSIKELGFLYGIKIICFIIVHDFCHSYIKWRTKRRPYIFNLPLENYLPKPVFTEIVEQPVKIEKVHYLVAKCEEELVCV